MRKKSVQMLALALGAVALSGENSMASVNSSFQPRGNVSSSNGSSRNGIPNQRQKRKQWAQNPSTRPKANKR